MTGHHVKLFVIMASGGSQVELCILKTCSNVSLL